MKTMKTASIRALAGLLSCAFLTAFPSLGSASITPEIVNGSFNIEVSPGTEVPPVAPPWQVANGTPELVVDGSEPANNTGFSWQRSPDGGSFAKLNGPFDPVFLEAIQQSIDGFMIGQLYQLEFYVTNTGFYFPTLSEWNDTPGYIEFYIDGALVGQSAVIAAPGSQTEQISWSPGSVTFVASSETHLLRIEATTTAPQGSTPSRNTTAYMAIDGVRLTSEICDNGIDDDFDGLVDLEDPDCQEPYEPVGLLVRCLHEPLWPEEGERVVIHAEAIGAEGQLVQADSIEIFTSDPDNPIGSQTGGSSFGVGITPTGSRMRYGCRAERGNEASFSGWRETDVGSPELPDMRAVPVVYNGRPDNKIDIVFMPEANRHSIGADAWDRFLDDSFQAIWEGIYGIPWFVAHQRDINFWLARDLGNVGTNLLGLCNRNKPDGFSKNFAFADAVGMIHGENCRDNVSPTSWRVFTTRANNARWQVVSHEIGHAVFKLSDEYVGQGTIFFTLPDYPNLLPTESGCRNAAEARGANPDNCRSILLSGGRGFSLGGNWIFEPNFRIDTAPWTEVRDLMQQTGGEGQCTTTNGDPRACFDRYRVGDSERSRMNWKIQKCRAGRC